MDRLPAIRPLHGTQDRGARPSQDALDALGSRIPGGIPLSARNRAMSVMNVTEKRFCVGHYVFDPKHSSTLLPSKRPAPQRAAFLSRVGFVCFATRGACAADARERAQAGTTARRHEPPTTCPLEPGPSCLTRAARYATRADSRSRIAALTRSAICSPVKPTSACSRAGLPWVT